MFEYLSMFDWRKLKITKKQTHTKNLKLYWIVQCMVYVENSYRGQKDETSNAGVLVCCGVCT